MWYLGVMFTLYIVVVILSIFALADGGPGYWQARDDRQRIQNGEDLYNRYYNPKAPKSLAEAIEREKRAFKTLVFLILAIVFGPALWLPVVICAALYGLYYVSKAFIGTMKLKSED